MSHVCSKEALVRIKHRVDNKELTSASKGIPMVGNFSPPNEALSLVELFLLPCTYTNATASTYILEKELSKPKKNCTTSCEALIYQGD